MRLDERERYRRAPALPVEEGSSSGREGTEASVLLRHVEANQFLPQPTLRELYNIPSIQDWLKEEIQPSPPGSLLDLAAAMATRLAFYHEFTELELGMFVTKTRRAAYWFWTMAEHNSCQMAELLLHRATQHFYPYVLMHDVCERVVVRHFRVLCAFRDRETKQLVAQVESGFGMEQGNGAGESDSDGDW